MPDLEARFTADGSSTLYADQFGECYHSRHGAVQESQHVFLDMGLHNLSAEKQDIHLLEVGFGTGLNALMTCLQRGERRVRYLGLEAYPPPEALLAQLNYAEQFDDPAAGEVFRAIQAAEWQAWMEIVPGFALQKLRSDFTRWTPAPELRFDGIYFDAFAPNAQPEMWEEAHFTRLRGCLNPGGFLVTYCAKGEVRRRLQRAGFTVERLPGPPGKREMLRGVG